MMTAADFAAWLVEATLAGSLALLAVLALRRPLRALFGAGAAHAAWAAVPAALFATLLPAMQAPLPVMPMVVVQAPIAMLAEAAPREAAPNIAAWTCIAWACGCLGFAACLGWQQRRFMRGLGRIADRGDGIHFADAIAGLPAVVGLLRPRIVMPADALSRYDADERSLMLAHEREHIRHGDLLANVGVVALRCLFWFNPLLHYAARRFRDDQELACDARVIARNPQQRRTYGEAMLKTQLAAQCLPLGCHWGQSHPLKERIEMLKQPTPSFLRRIGGRALVIAILLASGYAAWKLQPAVPQPANPALLTKSVDMSRDKTGMREVVAALAREHGMSVSGMELVPADRQVSFYFKEVPMETVLELLGEESGLDFRLEGARIEISRKAGASAAAADEAKAPLASVDAASRMLNPPIYPVDAQKEGVTGRVVLVVDVAVDGSVAAAQVDRSAGDERLDNAALRAVSQWRFSPAMKNGKPVHSQVRVPIDFEMHDEAAAERSVRAAPAERANNGASNEWGSYDRMVHSLAASWTPPAPRQDDC